MEKASQQHSAGHETRDAKIAPIVLTGAGLALTVAIVGLVVYGVFQYLETHPPTSARPNPMSAEESQIPPAPRIEEHPAIEIQQLHSQENNILSTYGWTDKKAGVVRIPIDRAMELQLERGFPTRKEAPKQ
jgi:hypothetical protein